MKYDYLIIGSGLFGAVFAFEANLRGKKCLILEKRNHIGGNVFTENIENIQVHKYGPHIFHTNDEKIWNYVNKCTPFKPFVYTPLSNSNNKLYNLPFNMNTFYQLWGCKTPIEAQNIINEQIQQYGVKNPNNLEEQALSLVGKDIYETLIKEYTEKQWGKKATELPAFIIKRLPVRFIYDNNYFNDIYQGIPTGGYTAIINYLLKDIEVKLNTDYFENKDNFSTLANKIIFTGKIDQFFNYQFGELAYRSLKFEHTTLNIPNYQGSAVINYNDIEVPYTRIIEHKHFDNNNQPTTIITKEYPQMYNKTNEPMYPINDTINQTIYNKYKEYSKQFTNVIFGGRLAEYKYYDMHQIIGSALKTVQNEFKE